MQPGHAFRTIRIRHGDGEWRFVESKITNLLDNPAVRGMVLNSRDVSDRKRAEAKLVHDALKRRCLYHWIDYPDAAREYEIVLARVPDTPERLAEAIVAFVQRLRQGQLTKVPGVAETIDWAAALLALGSGFLPRLFSDNPAVTDVTRLFLLVAPISYGAYGIVMVVNAAFNGLGNPMPGVVISLTRILILYVPLAFVGQMLFGIVGIFAAYAVANIASGALGYVWAMRNTHRLAVAHVHADAAAGHERHESKP